MQMQPLEDYAARQKTEPKSSPLSLPTIPGVRNLDELVAHSRNMSSASSKSADEAETSLADSTYEVVDARHLVSDDELEVQSESLPSCGGNTTDCDVSSVADTEEYADNPASVSSLPNADYPTPAPSDEEFGGDSIVEESSTTVRPSKVSNSKLIQFPEPTRYVKSGQDAGTALVNQQIATLLPDHFPADLQPSVTNSEVPVGLRMRLSEKPLRPHGSFSIMFVGNLSGPKKDALIHKIASALATGQVSKPSNPSAPTRLNVVPISSFGLNESCPDVAMIEGTGTELLIETCTKSRKVYDQNGHVQALEAKINEDWVDMGSSEHVPVWKLQELPHTPHLAVFVYGPTDQTKSKMDSHDWVWDVEQEMYDRGVPGIHLAVQAQWELELPDRDEDSLLQMAANIGKQTDAVSPVDLDTFLRLHNGQLGRHLSFLESVRQDIHRHKSVIDPLMSYFSLDLSRIKLMNSPIIQTIMLISFVLSMIVLIVQLYTSTATPRPHQDAVGRASALNSSLIKLTNCTTAISAPPFNSLLSNIKPSEDASERAAHSRLSEAIANGTERFEAYPFADHFVAIKAPTGFTRLKDAPSLFVNASRDGKSLEANISKLVLEHYAVILEQEQSYGKVNLTVFTKTKPLIQQSMLVNLGSFWRNGAAMGAVVEARVAQGRHTATSLRSSFSDLTNRWITKASSNARDVKDKIKPGIIDTARSGTDAGVAAGAATWKTIQFAQSIAAAEFSRIYGILSNSSQPRAALRKPQQVLSKFSTYTRAVLPKPPQILDEYLIYTRAALVSAKQDFNKTIESLVSQISRAQPNLSRRPKFLRRLSASSRGPSSRLADLEKIGIPVKKMRRNAISIRDKVFGKKPVSKAVGPSLSAEHVRKYMKSGARNEKNAIHIDSETRDHAKTKKETEPRLHNLEKETKQRKKQAEEEFKIRLAEIRKKNEKRRQASKDMIHP